MLKKYLPLILLIAAAGLLYWIKIHQRGTALKVSATTKVSIPSVDPITETSGLIRDVQGLTYSKHARCRMECRHIDEFEVQEILKSGDLNEGKIAETVAGKTYPLEGVTRDKQHVRIVVAPHDRELVVVTVIDLDTEWQCNCN